MARLPKQIEKILLEWVQLPIEEQRRRHFGFMRRLMEIATLTQLRGLLESCEPSELYEILGEQHRLDVLHMIEGHIALRRMRLVKRKTDLDHLADKPKRKTRRRRQG